MEIPINQPLFPDFLSSPEAYAEAQAYWQSTLTELLAGCACTLLSPFYNEASADGTPLRDGNPLFSAYIPERQKLLRIIQFHPGPDDLPFTTWEDGWPAEDMPAHFPLHADTQEGAVVPELVIALALNAETAAQAQAAVRAWVAA